MNLIEFLNLNNFKCPLCNLYSTGYKITQQQQTHMTSHNLNCLKCNTNIQINYNDEHNYISYSLIYYKNFYYFKQFYTLEFYPKENKLINYYIDNNNEYIDLDTIINFPNNILENKIFE